LSTHAVTSELGYLVTAAEDKTIKLWELSSGRYLTTYRIPISSGHEGLPIGLDVHPLTKEIAVGGITGFASTGAGAVYILDFYSGEITKRLEGLEASVKVIEYSDDGKHLVVGLAAGQGIRVFNPKNGRLLYTDKTFSGDVTCLDFAADGRMLVVSSDRSLRIYSKDFEVTSGIRLSEDLMPFQAYFSPDGAKVAVGVFDRPAVALFSSAGLTPLKMLKIAEDWADSVMAIEWGGSVDWLYGVVQSNDYQTNRLVKWNVASDDAPQELQVEHNGRILSVEHLRDGRFVYTTDNPGFGLLAADGAVVYAKNSDVFAMPYRSPDFRVSVNGDAVSLPDAGSGGSVVFDLNTLAFRDTEDAEALSGRTVEPDARLAQDWKDSFEPKISGRLVDKEWNELIRSASVSSDAQRVAFGGDWSVYFYSRSGELVWRSKIPAAARNIHITPNGRFVVAGCSDGTVRWFDTATGAEVLALFLSKSAQDWVLWEPGGYYVSSEYGDNYIGWHINNELGTPDFFRAVQFEGIYYQPEKLQRYIENLFEDKLQQALRIAKERSVDVKNVLPPDIDLKFPAWQVQEVDGDSLEFLVSATKNSLPMETLSIFVNGIPVTTSQDKALDDKESSKLRKKVRIALKEGLNQVRIEVGTESSIGVLSTSIFSKANRKKEKPKGDLYLVSIGVSKYPNFPKSAQLRFAANDSVAVAQFFKEQAGRDYENVYVTELNDFTFKVPDKAAILQSLSKISASKANDTVVVFLAAHGVSDPFGEYYLVPRDGTAEDVAALNSADSEPESLVSWRAFVDALRDVAGERFLVVDTCHAGSIEGTLDFRSLEKRSASSNFLLMAAAEGGQESQEYGDEGRGLFTYALLDSFSEELNADAKSGQVQRVFEETGRFVDRNRPDKSKPQTPLITGPDVLREAVIVR